MLSFVVLVSKDGVYLSSAVVPLYTGFVEGKVILYSFFKFEYSLWQNAECIVGGIYQDNLLSLRVDVKRFTNVIEMGPIS
mgnify:CR=1 FL=1